MNTIVNISVVAGREYKISSPELANIQVYYNGMLVAGPALNNRFVATHGASSVTIVSSTQLTSSLTVSEYLRNIYDPNDGQGGVVSFREKWLGGYGFRPEWFGTVSNRLVTFLSGVPYIHNGAKNSFYGQVQDSSIAFAHNEAGNVVKTYRAASVEGDTPDRIHVRTEKPYTQSSDLVTADFEDKEGVKYSPILRDRLSPNTAGTVIDKLYKGDLVRGEIAKFQVVFSQPSTEKNVNFVNIHYDKSIGQIV